MGGKRHYMHIKFGWKCMKETDQLEDQFLDGSKTLNRILNK
jgi:hypothetical protein